MRGLQADNSCQRGSTIPAACGAAADPEGCGCEVVAAAAAGVAAGTGAGGCGGGGGGKLTPCAANTCTSQAAAEHYDQSVMSPCVYNISTDDQVTNFNAHKQIVSLLLNHVVRWANSISGQAEL